MSQPRILHVLSIALVSAGCATEQPDAAPHPQAPIVIGGTGGAIVPSLTAGTTASTAGSVPAAAGVPGSQAGTAGTAAGTSGSAGAPNAGSGGSSGAAGADAGPSAPSSGCGKPWMPPDAAMEQSRRGGMPMLVARREIMIAGAARLYLVAVPTSYDASRPYPLVFGFHGSAGSREQLRGYMNVETPAAGQALFLYPEGLPVNGGSTGWALGADSADLMFVDALLEQYRSELCVDENRIFATGHSYGGCMTNTVGCFRGDVFRAIAPVAGCGPQRGRGGSTCTGQVAALLIHSPKDTATEYRSGISGCTNWLRANHCDEMPMCGCYWVEALSDSATACMQEAVEPYEPGVPVEVTAEDDAPPAFRSSLNCDPGYPVIFIDHYNREDRDTEERWHNPPPWAPAVIWHFFTSLPAAATP